MFNYAEIDKYPTIETLIILFQWIVKNEPRLKGYMISNVRRENDNYFVSFTCASNGTTRKYKVVGETVERDLQYDGGFWMS